MAISFAGGSCHSAGVAVLGEESALKIGDSIIIEGEELQIKFLEVTGDSRCPKGVTCIWAGEVSCMVEIKYQESINRLTLTQPGSTDWPPERSFREYKLAYHVEPYPVAGAEISEDEYRLHLTVVKR
ncbi:MAG: hypothetical protein JSW16_02350 [Dehalococcoidales bacterium]|nr:MAG: hypothetical protein JSW16_02350 [Dehalococcoidales bacterium]